MNNQEYYDYEDRRYVNPVTSRDEQLTFANNLRSVANNDIAKIRQDTYNLGTHVPSNLGGLAGSTGLWRRNYVSPKVESMTQGLRAVAQSAALESAMNNYLNQKKQQYQNTYKAYAKRSRGGSGGGGSGGGGYYGTGPSGSGVSGDIDWATILGLAVNENNVGDAATNDSLTKGEQNIDVSLGDNVAGGATGAAIGSVAGGILAPIAGPWGSIAGAALGGWLGSRSNLWGGSSSGENGE